MVPPGKRIIFNPECTIPATASHAFSSMISSVGLVVLVLEDRVADVYYQSPDIATAKDIGTSFLIVETDPDPAIEEQIHQAACELCACAKQLNKGVVRGALTNGRGWIFVIVHFDHSNDETSYKITTRFKLTSTPAEDPKLRQDTIAGILSYWISQSSVELEDDDWFEVNGG